MNVNKISKIVLKLWVGDDDMEEKHKKIIKNDKDSVETRITERRIVIMTQNSTVDLRNRFIAVMIQKTW